MTPSDETDSRARNVRASVGLHVYFPQDPRAVLERGILNVSLDGLVASRGEARGRHRTAAGNVPRAVELG